MLQLLKCLYLDNLSGFYRLHDAKNVITDLGVVSLVAALDCGMMPSLKMLAVYQDNDDTPANVAMLWRACERRGIQP